MPYRQEPYGQAPAPKKSNTGLIITLVTIGVVLLASLAAVLGVIVLKVKDAGTIVATDLVEGDCITDIPDASLVKAVPTVDCIEPHAGEVYAVLTMPSGEFPGQATITEWQNKCPAALASYSPDAMADESIGVFVLYPTEETWAQGDRVITCIATTDAKRTGSVKG